MIGPTTREVLSPFALLVLGFIGWKSRWNPLRAFGVTPASLLRTSVAWFRIPDFQSQLSFRHQFGSAFGDVCGALGDRRLVIIIDDLDRCRPDQVAVILEAVNFLTSSGDCFVLLGIDDEHVKCAVGLHYHELAAEPSRSTRTEDNNGGNVVAGRWTFADDYLEKVINHFTEQEHGTGLIGFARDRRCVVSNVGRTAAMENRMEDGRCVQSLTRAKVGFRTQSDRIRCGCPEPQVSILVIAQIDYER